MGNQTNPYIGRFAPSPTGPLHFGSLIAALASYLDARHYHGQWLIRIEDIDPPREQVGACDAILRTLEAHHLFWDSDVLYQSKRLPAYQDALDELQRRHLIYPCYCTRKALASSGGPYPGTCRQSQSQPQNLPAALRLLTEPQALPGENIAASVATQIDDLFLGQFSIEHPLGDYIVKRKDGLFSYQFAVVVDDIFQGINHVIRGVDLIDSTPSQQYLFQLFDSSPPLYGHIPLALNKLEQKLSKQHGASAIDDSQSRNNLFAALRFLNHTPDQSLDQASSEELLTWAIAHWDRQRVPSRDAVANDQ